MKFSPAPSSSTPTLASACSSRAATATAAPCAASSPNARRPRHDHDDRTGNPSTPPRHHRTRRQVTRRRNGDGRIAPFFPETGTTGRNGTRAPAPAYRGPGTRNRPVGTGDGVRADVRGVVRSDAGDTTHRQWRGFLRMRRGRGPAVRGRRRTARAEPRHAATRALHPHRHPLPRARSLRRIGERRLPRFRDRLRPGASLRRVWIRKSPVMCYNENVHKTTGREKPRNTRRQQ